MQAKRFPCGIGRNLRVRATSAGAEEFTCDGLRGQARWKLGYTAAEFTTILAPKQLREQFDSLARHLQGAPRD